MGKTYWEPASFGQSLNLPEPTQTNLSYLLRRWRHYLTMNLKIVILSSYQLVTSEGPSGHFFRVFQGQEKESI